MCFGVTLAERREWGQQVTDHNRQNRYHERLFPEPGKPWGEGARNHPFDPCRFCGCTYYPHTCGSWAMARAKAEPGRLRRKRRRTNIKRFPRRSGVRGMSKPAGIVEIEKLEVGRWLFKTFAAGLESGDTLHAWWDDYEGWHAEIVRADHSVQRLEVRVATAESAPPQTKDTQT